MSSDALCRQKAGLEGFPLPGPSFVRCGLDAAPLIRTAAWIATALRASQ
jgi:hypothetical protein